MSPATEASNTRTRELDAVIVGGGIAGAWLLNLLSSRGYQVALLEQHELGGAQTGASQGMIHGGMKYALAGALTGASEAIARMPARWRACLAGEGEVDLRGTELLSEHYHMFASATARGRLTTFFASKSLRGRIDKLNPAQWPGAFAGFDGHVYALNDFVLETRSLLRQLTEPWQDRIYHHRLCADDVTLQTAASSSRDEAGYHIRMGEQTISTRYLIACAGNGNIDLLADLGVSSLPMQQRPLKQIIVRPRHNTALYAHCLTGIRNNEPRLTITTHPTPDGPVWYLGGALATTGVHRSDAEQIAFAAGELKTCLPWLDWQGADYETLWVNRAEPRHEGGLKPDEASVRRQDNLILCFPTKLTLTPDLGDKVLDALAPPSCKPVSWPEPIPVGIARHPWQ